MKRIRGLIIVVVLLLNFSVLGKIDRLNGGPWDDVIELTTLEYHNLI